MEELHITLTGTTRADGSVMIVSTDLPLFSAIGKDEASAVKVAMEILPEYLRINVPDFVKVRSGRSVYSELSGEERPLPAHMIAVVGGSSRERVLD